MEDTKPIRSVPSAAGAPDGTESALAAAPSTLREEPSRPIVSFHRTELFAILNIYGRMVAAGEWRDYAIDCLSDQAVFSIFRRASEMPLYRIVKQPKLQRRQGAFAVVNAHGFILKRGHDLRQVLKVLDRKTLKVVD